VGNVTNEQGRILVVDDNRVNRMKLTISLQQEGYTVTTAEDGQQALDILQSQPQDAILLDIVMPGMDGFEVLEHIKADPQLRDIPVIVISAVDELDSVVRCIEQGAEDYLPKSYNPVVLRARLSACMQRKKLRDLEKIYLQQEVMLRQNEKLATLGKLSAGLAHEMNNPAASVQRSAGQLSDIFSHVQQAGLALLAHNLSPVQQAQLSAIDLVVQEQLKAYRPLSTLERSDLENNLQGWLEAHAIDRLWEVAPVLADVGLDRTRLEALVQPFSAKQWNPILTWLTGNIQISTLAKEIAMGAGRITEIVHALKSYTYMDQAPVQRVDIHASLDNTLVILRSKLVEANIKVVRDYAPDLPEVEAHGSELNQVWTNLIDNAIDAIGAIGAIDTIETIDTTGANGRIGIGQITLHTRCEGTWVVVEIEDNGPGIPEAVRSTLFDPFTTTKPVGKGTGLGLNISHNIIVQKHNGKIQFHSQPGRTCFEVWLPLKV
jgi:signal transduction histidine kinase